MTASWAAVVVAALIAAGAFLRWSNQLAALLARLTVKVEQHDEDIDELRRALARRNSRRVP